MVDTTILGLCSGVGMLEEGIITGLRYLGRKGRVLAHIERDAYAASVLLARMESKALEPAPVWAGNLEDVRWEQFTGAVDILCAGFPCQPHSMAGSRKGTEDERWIWPAITDCIRVVRPRIVLLENVSGLRSSGGMAPVLADLAALGFRVEWDSIRASDVGAAHQRERVFIFAYMDDADGSERRPCRICGRGCQQGKDCCGQAHGWAGVSGSSCMGNTARERFGEARQCDCKREPGTGEHGAELALPERSSCERQGISGNVACKSREVEGEARQRERCGNASDDCCIIVADTVRAGCERNKQRAGIDKDRRTDGRTDGRSKYRTDQLPNFVMYLFSHQDQTMNDGQQSLQQDLTSHRRLNAQFVDWLMGWPPGWSNPEPTACGAEATELWRCKLDSHLLCLLGEQELFERKTA